MKTLVFDTETSGLPLNWGGSPDDPGHPHLMQLGVVFLEDRYPVFELGTLIKPHLDYKVDPMAWNIHGISREMCEAYGGDANFQLAHFIQLCASADRIVAHNLNFDRLVMLAFGHRLGVQINSFNVLPTICTMLKSTNVCKIPGSRSGYKWPKLDEAFRKLVDPNGFPDAHNASADCWACIRVLWALEDGGHI